MTFLLIINLVIMKHYNEMQGAELKTLPFLCISHLILQYRTVGIIKKEIVKTTDLTATIRVIVSSHWGQQNVQTASALML